MDNLGTDLCVLVKGAVSSVNVNTQAYIHTEVSSFQGVGIEGFHCILSVSSFQGVGIEGFHCILRCPHFRVLE